MIKLSIRQLVELVMRSGDIDSRYVSRDRLQEGARAHRTLQKRNQELLAGYRSEVTLTTDYIYQETIYRLEGRADGIFSLEGKETIEEIKTTLLPLETIDADHNSAHWAQAKCYAFIYARQNNLPQISIQLTYFNLETLETKRFLQTFSFAELEEHLVELLAQYSVWAAFSTQWEQTRNQSIKSLQFPYPQYRKGQRELAVQVYRTIEERKKLFAQAPTGTGKTISTLFPAIKAMGEGKSTKIFYLTAKTISRQVAEEALAKMRANGLKIKSLTLTAKEKICFCEKTSCRPDYCPYAKGHFDRINRAILHALQEEDDFSRNMIEAYAQKYMVCPFEFSLDLSWWADCIIGDYNYVFDPQAQLRQFFIENENGYVFLIDEAHNLVDRSREMFSAAISKTQFYELKKQYKGKNKALDRILTKINRSFIEERKQCDRQGYRIRIEKPADFIALVQKYIAICKLMLKENKDLGEDDNFLQLYLNALNFLTIADFYDQRYITFVESQGHEVILKLFCLDPSFLLADAFRRGRSAILFSATLSPLTYFRDILGGDDKDKILSLDSPFDKDNLCVLTAVNVSTKYHDREASTDKLIHLIASFVTSQKGNYIVYFPSYQYMNDVYRQFTLFYPLITAVKQESSMSEGEREEFLTCFEENPQDTYVAFCVLGGIFSEGIDLPGSRLIGTVIVSVGLPQLNIQQNIIRDYFNRKNGLGFEYAYMYPGMNKVLQAGGRVIRSETDRGAILLIDERFGHNNYLKLLPKHWRPIKIIKDNMNLSQELQSFWLDKKKK